MTTNDIELTDDDCAVISAYTLGNPVIDVFSLSIFYELLMPTAYVVAQCAITRMMKQ